MNNWIKIALLAIGAWWLLKDQLEYGTSEAAQTPNPTSVNPAQPSSFSAASTATQNPDGPLATTRRRRQSTSLPIPTPSTEAMIIAAAGNAQLASTVPDVFLTSDEWNYYEAIATGTQEGIDLYTAGNRSERINAAEYWRRRTAAGLGLLVWR